MIKAYSRSLFLLVTLSVLLCLMTGCASTWQNGPKEPMKPYTRVGLITVDEGVVMANTARQNYLYHALLDLDFEAVALNDIDVSGALIGPAGGGRDFLTKPEPKAPNLLTTLHPHFKALKLDYLLIVDISSKNRIDYSLDVMLVRIKDMAMAAYKRHRVKTVTNVCWAIGWIPPGFIICPAVAYSGYDRVKAEINLLKNTLYEFLGTKRPST